MKTYNNLFERIIYIENIKKAIHNAAKNKKKLKSVKYALNNVDKVAHQVHTFLSNGTWTPPKYHYAHIINDGVSMKKRVIICPQFIREQVVHHALLQVIAPLLQKKFYEHACGSIPNRGREYALKYIRKNIKSNPKNMKYVCQIDIRKFFDSVRPSILFHSLRKTIRDRKVLGLCAKILRGNKIIHSDGSITKRGVPIGFFTSPWFTNTLMCAVDHFIKEELGVKVYTRYADDLILFGSNKRKLKAQCKALVNYLEFNCKLNVKHEVQVHRTRNRPFTFIGYTFYNNLVKLRKLVYLRMFRTIRRMSRKKKLTVYDARKALCYAGQFRYVNCWTLFHTKFLSYVKPKLCRSIVRQKGTLQ